MKLGELKSIQHLLPDDIEIQIVSGVCASTTQTQSAKWITWGGWRGNHDQRIECSKCSNCGYEHPTVYGSLDKLSKFCPNCGLPMSCEED